MIIEWLVWAAARVILEAVFVFFSLIIALVNPMALSLYISEIQEVREQLTWKEFSKELEDE